LSKTTADKEKLFITKEEEIFLESISDKEIPEKILMMDVFFGTKSTVFEKVHICQYEQVYGRRMDHTN
jgi:hypothetical protein